MREYMAITKNAKRAIRGAEKKRITNMRRLRTMRAVTKETENLSKEGKKDEAKAKLSEAYKAIDKAVKRGVIKKNTASRRKSRLAKRIK